MTVLVEGLMLGTPVAIGALVVALAIRVHHYRGDGS